MAVFPTLESILLEIHQSMGLKGHQTREKLKFRNLEKRFSHHKERVVELIDDIFSSLGLEPDEALDLLDNLEELAQFLRSVELKVFALGASERQVLWTILGYILAPGLGRKVAIWDHCNRLDPGMPGGRFWFLPRRSGNGTDGLSLPVQNVMVWLVDIMGLSLEQLARSLETDQHQPGTVKATLRNWKSGKTLPTPDVIEKYFREGLMLDFRGAFSVESHADDTGLAFQRALEFVVVRRLTPDDLREQIPMTRPGQIESLLAGQGSQAEKDRFVQYLNQRYAAPSLATIRRRLLVARTIQDGYLRLAAMLCPGIDAKKNENPGENKLLQLQAIFERAYNLTISSYAEASSDEEEYGRFRSSLTELEQQTIFLSLMIHHAQHSVDLVSDLVNERFRDTSPDDYLENLVGYDQQSLLAVVHRELDRKLADNKRLDAVISIKNHLPLENYEAVLGGIDSWDVAISIAEDPEIPPFVQLEAVFRSREIVSSPQQEIRSCLFLLHFLLNVDRRLRPAGGERIVERLLDEAGKNPCSTQYKAAIDQYRARHYLSKNQFNEAKQLFREAREECKQRTCGRLRGEIARDLLAVEVGLGRLIPESHEAYWRDMLAFGLFQEGWESLEAVAKWAGDYFWSDLYVPYDGYTPRSRQSM